MTNKIGKVVIRTMTLLSKFPAFWENKGFVINENGKGRNNGFHWLLVSGRKVTWKQLFVCGHLVTRDFSVHVIFSEKTSHNGSE